MLSPYLWSEDAEVQWIVIGLSQLPFIESPERLAEADAQALTHLVSSSAGKESGIYTGKLEGKLVWDRLMHSPASERAAIAARLTQQQAGRFTEYFGVPHADWLCASLADAQTRDALDRLWKLLWEPDGKQFAARILEKCGVAIGSAADPTARRRSLLDEAASRRGAPAATLASPAPAMAPRPVTR